MPLHVLDSELTKLVQQVSKQHMNSFQPRPKKGRRPGRGHAAQSSQPTTVEDIRGMSYSAIAKATTVSVGGPIVPGTGLAKLYDPPGAGVAGVAWQPRPNPVTVENWMFDAISANKPIFLRKSRDDPNNQPIYVVIAEGCKPITAS